MCFFYTPARLIRLELGAGGGLVGLAVAAGCSIDTPVLITDQDTMFSLMKRNIALNKLEGKAEAVILNWYVPSHSLRLASMGNPGVFLVNETACLLALDSAKVDGCIVCVCVRCLKRVQFVHSAVARRTAQDSTR